MVAEAAAVVRRRRGQVVWLQESTTGWARVQRLLARVPLRFTRGYSPSPLRG